MYMWVLLWIARWVVFVGGWVSRVGKQGWINKGGKQGWVSSVG